MFFQWAPANTGWNIHSWMLYKCSTNAGSPGCTKNEMKVECCESPFPITDRENNYCEQLQSMHSLGTASFWAMRWKDLTAIYRHN